VLLTVAPYLTLVYYTTGMANLKIVPNVAKDYFSPSWKVRLLEIV